MPIIVAVLAWLTGGSDTLTVTRWAGLLAGGGGAAGRAQCRRGADWPITEVLLGAVCYAIGPLIASRKLSGLPPVGKTAACLAFAAVVYAPLAALTWTSALPSAKVLAAVAGLAVICTAVAFLLFFRLIAEVRPARASVMAWGMIRSSREYGLGHVVVLMVDGPLGRLVRRRGSATQLRVARQRLPPVWRRGCSGELLIRSGAMIPAGPCRKAGDWRRYPHVAGQFVNGH